MKYEITEDKKVLDLSVYELSNKMSNFLALVKATLILLKLDRNPTSYLSFDLTVDIIITSFSLP